MSSDQTCYEVFCSDIVIGNCYCFYRFERAVQLYVFFDVFDVYVYALFLSWLFSWLVCLSSSWHAISPDRVKQLSALAQKTLFINTQSDRKMLTEILTNSLTEF